MQQPSRISQRNVEKSAQPGTAGKVNFFSHTLILFTSVSVMEAIKLYVACTL